MARFDASYTANFYDKYGSREWTRWESNARTRMQHAVFQHHLRERVRTGDRVLDAGCGPGVFTTLLLELGAQVTCIDVSPVQLDACRARAPGCVAYELGSVTDLSRFGDGSFDVTLGLGGVLSYCFDQAPRATTELVRVTRPGGRVGVSVMNLLGTIHRFLPKVMATPLATNQRIVATGNLERRDSDGHECHMFRVDEARALLLASGLEEIELYANAWLVPDASSGLPEIGSEAWQFLFEAELEASRESPGAGTHIIAWARVP